MEVAFFMIESSIVIGRARYLAGAAFTDGLMVALDRMIGPRAKGYWKKGLECLSVLSSSKRRK